MSTLTPNLNLFKIIPSEDAKKPFNFYEILNENWDKLDNAYLSQKNQIQELLDKIYNTVYRIGQPLIRLDNYLAENEVRLEGEEKLISEFPLLYQVYGDTYGETRTGYFKLPDCRNRVFWGAETFGYIDAGLPQHEHYINVQYSRHGEGGGGAVINWCNGDWDVTPTPNPLSSQAVNNNIYGNSDTVQPPSIKVRVVTRFK